MHKRNTGYFISYGLPMLPCATYTYMNFIILFPFFPPFSRWGSVALLLRSHMRNKIESHKILNGIQLLCTAMRCSFGQSLHELTAFALFVGLNKWSVAKKKQVPNKNIRARNFYFMSVCRFLVDVYSHRITNYIRSVGGTIFPYLRISFHFWLVSLVIFSFFLPHHSPNGYMLAKS